VVGRSGFFRTLLAVQETWNYIILEDTTTAPIFYHLATASLPAAA